MKPCCQLFQNLESKSAFLLSTNTMLKLFRLTIVLPTALILLTAKVTFSQTALGSPILTNQSGESTASTTSADQSEEGPEVTTTTADQSEEKPETTTITMDLEKPVGKVSNPIDLLYQSCKNKGYGEDVCQALCDIDVAVDNSP